MACNKELADFLDKVKESNIIFVSRTKNGKTIRKLGLTVEEQEDIIYNLNANDYHSGPLDDYDKSKKEKLWVFKIVIQKIIVYIKLVIIVRDSKIVCMCISFHEDNI